MSRRRARAGLAASLTLLLVAVLPLTPATGAGAAERARTPGALAAAPPPPPNIFFYNLDDLRDAFPGGIDPLQFMPQVRRWMGTAVDGAAGGGRRYRQTFVADPSCCPSRASLMTGRYPHNNGVRTQQDGAAFDSRHSMACYLRDAGYATYLAGKFLTSWPRTATPPCFRGSTVIWGGYRDAFVRVDGVAGTARGYSTTYLGVRGREYVDRAVTAGTPFLLYETPQAPHWVPVTAPGGTVTRLAVPSARYRTAPVGPCAGVPSPTAPTNPPTSAGWPTRALRRRRCARARCAPS